MKQESQGKLSKDVTGQDSLVSYCMYYSPIRWMEQFKDFALLVGSHFVHFISVVVVAI